MSSKAIGQIRGHLTAVHAELHARFTTRVRRTLFTLKPDASTQIEGALDEGEIRTADGKSVEPVSEVELLLKDGNPAALYGTALRLLEIAPLRIEIRSKAERGYHLLGGGTDARQTQAYLPSNLKPDLTVEESLQRIGRNCLSTVLLCEAAATADMANGAGDAIQHVGGGRAAAPLLQPGVPSGADVGALRHFLAPQSRRAPARHGKPKSLGVQFPASISQVGSEQICFGHGDASAC